MAILAELDIEIVGVEVERETLPKLCCETGIAPCVSGHCLAVECETCYGALGAFVGECHTHGHLDFRILGIDLDGASALGRGDAEC